VTTTAARRAARSPGDLARGLGALTVTVGLLYGMPRALLAVAGNPLPDMLPTADAVLVLLTTPDDGTLFLTALAWAGWAGWASFALAVLTETAAALLERPAPRIPALGIQQHLARRLLGAIGLLLSAPLVIAVPPAHAISTDPPRAAVPAPAAATTTPTPPLGVTAAPGAPAPVEVVVATGDNLSGIAEVYLGAADRYVEIADATRGLVQPDGRTLADPDLIYPGWVLRVPDTTTTPTPGSPPLKQVTPPSAAAPAPAPPPVAAPPAATPIPGPTKTPSPAPTRPAPVPQVDTAPDRAAAPTRPTGAADTADVGGVVAVAAGLGALAAAGAVGVLTRRRARQQRHRRPGERLRPPDQAAAIVERHLRAAQDPLTAADLDTALRTLAATCTATGAALPRLHYARILATRIELHLDHPGWPLAPFTEAADHDTVWLLHRDDGTDHGTGLTGPVDEADEDGPAPYPALVAVGRDLDGAEVLMDLETTGWLTITAAGDPWGDHPAEGTMTQGVLAGLAVALATSPRAADTEVTLVGAHAGLVDALDVDTLTHTDDIDRLLIDLAAWSTATRRALTADGLPDAPAARATRRAPDAWTGRVVLLASDLTPDQAALLWGITDALPAVPLAVVGTHPNPQAPWTLALDPDGHLATLHPPALTVVPQTLPAQVRAVLLDPPVTDLDPTRLEPSTPPAATRGPDDLEQAPTTPPPDLRQQPLDKSAATVAPESPEIDQPPAGGPAPEVTAPPMVRVLGPVEVTGARGSIGDSSAFARMTELVTFLALYPHREHHLLDEALWPGERVPGARRNQLLSRTRRWLGTANDGTPYLPAVVPDGYRLTQAVTTDWAAFTALVGPDPRATATDALHTALGLVRGQPFAGTNPRRYAWADIDRQGMIAAIVDAAHEAFRRAYRADDATAARRAAATGLLAEPGSELLWRDAMRAEWLAGDRTGLETLADRFTRLAEELGDDLEEETETLLQELLNPPLRPTDTAGAARAH
jgi:hypothetical protein